MKRHIIYFFVTAVSLCMFSPSYGQIVAPMINTHWHQSTPYNNYCPPTKNGAPHSAAGCGAIAVAQILNKHRVSNHAYGHCVYTNSKTGIVNDVDFSTMSFDWNNILNSYSGNYTTAQANAVASLVYQTGVGMIMSYDSSSAPVNPGMMMWGLQHYLHFSPDCRYRNRKFYTTSEWIDMLNKELVNGRPLFYRGTWKFYEENVGHIFVIDGVDANGKYHVNFGHGNSQDKYVDLSVINQTNTMDRPGSRGVCYNHEQAMITDFKPMGDISESAYCQHPLILVSPMVLDGDQHNQSTTKKLGSTFTLKMNIRDCSMTAGTLAIGLGVYKNGVLQQVIRANKRNITINHAGYMVSPSYTYTLPLSLKQYSVGDVNHDNEVSVNDITKTVAYILSNEASGFFKQQADVNKDGEVTVADINGMVEKIINTSASASSVADEYDLCLVSSSDGENTWDKLFENARTEMKLSIVGDDATITMPTNHTLESYLYLREPIREVNNVMSSTVQGKAFRLALRNPSNNNFESILRLAITCNGQTTNYDLTNSIYSGCDVNFDILVPDSVINLTGKNYQVKAYYHEANTDNYIPLTTTRPTIPSNMKASDVDVYDCHGLLVRHIPAEDVATQYAATMLNLAPGEYVVKENGSSRIVKK